MGKFHEASKNLAENGDPSPTSSSSSSRIFFCDRCCIAAGDRITLKCLLVFILSLSVFLSALFLLIPPSSPLSGFDASHSLKLTASIQVYFRLNKPVSELVPRIPQLEDELYAVIGIPDTKVAVLSMHKSRIPSSTYVIFGLIPHPKGASINPVSLTALRSTLVELFLEEANLTLTSSTFGAPSSFQIVKFSSGITVAPWQPPRVLHTLFSFTLNNSIYDVRRNLDLLTTQLNTGLRLRFDENVYVQVTNKVGSTMERPVIVQASVLTETGSLQPHRLKQLAKTLKHSSSKNLGLNNTMFGRVKSVSLSSYLSHNLETDPPSPAPSLPPPCSATPSTNHHLSPCPSPTGSFHPLPFEHHTFIQGQDKSSSSSLLPHKTLFTGNFIGFHFHLLASSIVASHLLYHIF